MAKILDVPTSGSIADRTHSHNRAGQYIRNRRSPVQPIGTGRRAFIRSAFGAASTAWSGLTLAQQAAWAGYADSHPVTDSLGQSIKLTGHQMFVAIATQLQNVEATISNTPPISDVVNAPTGVIITADAAPQTLTVAYDAGTAGDYILVAFSPQLSSGRTFTNVFWQAAVVAADALGDYNGLAAYTAQFGALVAGKRIFVKLTPVNAHGVTGTPVITPVTVIP